MAAKPQTAPAIMEKLNVKFRGTSELRFKNEAIIPDAEVCDLIETFKHYILSCSILYRIISKLDLGAHSCNLTVYQYKFDVSLVYRPRFRPVWATQ